MSKPLANKTIDVLTADMVTFQDKTYEPGTMLWAQAVDGTHNRWFVGQATGNADCVVDRRELARHQSDGSITSEFKF